MFLPFLSAFWPSDSHVFYTFLNKLLPQEQFGFRKGVDASDALIFITQYLQASLDTGYELRFISLDFSSAFDLVNHEAFLFKAGWLMYWRSKYNQHN